MPQQVRPLGRRGLYNQVFQRGELPFLRIQCRESYPPPSRLPARSVRGRAPPALAHPPSRKRNEWARVACWYGRGRSFNTSHFKGGCCPLCIPHEGEVSPAGSVGVGKAPLALNASPAPPPTRRGFGLGCRLGRPWTVPTGHQDPSRQARRCHAGGVTEGVSFQKIPSPVSAAASVGSRQSATGARSPPSRCYSMCRRGPCRNGRGSFFISFPRGPWAPLRIPLLEGESLTL